MGPGCHFQPMHQYSRFRHRDFLHTIIKTGKNWKKENQALQDAKDHDALTYVHPISNKEVPVGKKKTSREGGEYKLLYIKSCLIHGDSY